MSDTKTELLKERVDSWYSSWHRFAEEGEAPPADIQKIIDVVQAQNNTFFDFNIGVWIGFSRWRDIVLNVASFDKVGSGDDWDNPKYKALRDKWKAKMDADADAQVLESHWNQRSYFETAAKAISAQWDGISL